MQTTRLAQINAENTDKKLSSIRHQELVAGDANIADAVLSATSSLIEYLEQKTDKTEVINPVTSVSTPDVDGVVKALQVVNQTIQEQEGVDLTQVVQLLQGVIAAVSALPTSYPEVNIPETVTIANQVDNTPEFAKLEKAVKAIKLTAEAPVVNVPETTVNVDAPDLKPIEKGLEGVTKAVKVSADDMATAFEKTASGIITEKFDEYRINYTKDDFSEEKVVSGITYLLKGKKIAKLEYKYDSNGDLKGAKRA